MSTLIFPRLFIAITGASHYPIITTVPILLAWTITGCQNISNPWSYPSFGFCDALPPRMQRGEPYKLLTDREWLHKSWILACAVNFDQSISNDNLYHASCTCLTDHKSCIVVRCENYINSSSWFNLDASLFDAFCHSISRIQSPTNISAIIYLPFLSIRIN